MEYANVRIPKHVAEKIKVEAQKNYRTISAQITYMVDKFTKVTDEIDDLVIDKAYWDAARSTADCYEFDSTKAALRFLDNIKKEHERTHI